MFLPDPSDASIGLSTSAAEGINDGSPVISCYSNFGLSLPPHLHPESYESDARTNDMLGDLKAGQPVEMLGLKTENDDHNALFSIIRELVEETSEWDPSLFVDENFKSMIQNSRILVSKGSQGISDAERRGLSLDTIPPDRSEELDLGLLGIDILSNGGKTLGDSKAKHSNPSPAEQALFTDETGDNKHSDKL
jgi:hypothetical protein